MSSPSSLLTSSTIQQHDQETAAQSPSVNESSILSQPLVDHSIISSPTTPVLSDQILTQNDHEDNIVDNIDAVIRNYLSEFNGQQLNRIMFRWTTNDVPNFNYTVVIAINRPIDL